MSEPLHRPLTVAPVVISIRLAWAMTHTHTQKVRSYNVIDFKHTSAQEEAMLSKRNSSCAHRSSVHKITYNTVHDTESMSDV